MSWSSAFQGMSERFKTELIRLATWNLLFETFSAVICYDSQSLQIRWVGIQMKKIKNLISWLLRPFIVVLPAKINGCKFKILIKQGRGASNLKMTELWMVDALSRLVKQRPTGLFMDIGVNLGQTLLKFKSVASDYPYLGFEPNPFCIRYTQQLIDLNHFENASLIPTGLSSKPGIVSFIADSEADAAGSIITDLRPDKKVRREQFIPVFALDDIFAGLTDEEPSLIKIDVEGAELEVITGMQATLKHYRPIILCEVLHAHSENQLEMLQQRNAQLYQRLTDLDYQVYQWVKNETADRIQSVKAVSEFNLDTWNPATSPAVCDYVFIPNESVDSLLPHLNA